MGTEEPGQPRRERSDQQEVEQMAEPSVSAGQTTAVNERNAIVMTDKICSESAHFHNLGEPKRSAFGQWNKEWKDINLNKQLDGNQDCTYT